MAKRQQTAGEKKGGAKEAAAAAEQGEGNEANAATGGDTATTGGDEEQQEGAAGSEGHSVAPVPPLGPAAEATFKTGDIVIGIAAKSKESFDNQRCEVIAVLSRQYKVKMLTGPSRWEEHKYLHKNVKAVEEPEPPEPPPAPEGGVEPDVAEAPEVPADSQQETPESQTPREIDKIFDDLF